MGSILATGAHAIMTTRAIAADASMTESGWPPRGGGVAGIAFLRDWNVGSRLACSTHTVVTTGTRIDDARVIKMRCAPIQRAVTGTAIQ